MLKTLEDLISLIFEYVGMALQALMVLVVCYTIVTRYFFSHTPAWGEATALLCMVWFGFLSIALGVRDELHLSVNILDPLFPKWLQKPLALLKHVSILACGVFMITQGYVMADIGRLNLLSGLSVSSAFLYAAVPTAGVAIVLYSFTHILETLKLYQQESEDVA